MAAKKEIDLTGNYGQIKYDVRDKFDLSNNEYLMMDFIATMQGRPSKNNPGYCEASPEYLAAVIGVAKRNYFAICNRLEAKGLLERHPESRKPRVTVMAFDAMKGKSDETSPEKVSDETSPENTKAVTKRHQSGDETSLHYNTVYNTDSFYNTDLPANAAEPENLTLPLKEKKEKRDTPAPGAARPKKEKTGRKDHTFTQTFQLLKEKNAYAHTFFLNNPDIWDSVMRYRIEINSKFASAESEAIAMVKFWKDCKGRRENAEAMIEKTVSAGYKGFFPVENKQQTTRPQTGHPNGVNPYTYS